MTEHKTVITFGTFDLLHVGHVNILQQAKALGSRLVVGVSSDSMNVIKKKRRPIYSQWDRMKIVMALECVDEVFLEESMALKTEYIRYHRADILVMGNDWEGKFGEIPCQVLYLKRTPGISTTEILNHVIQQQ